MAFKSLINSNSEMGKWGRRAELLRQQEVTWEAERQRRANMSGEKIRSRKTEHISACLFIHVTVYLFVSWGVGR